MGKTYELILSFVVFMMFFITGLICLFAPALVIDLRKGSLFYKKDVSGWEDNASTRWSFRTIGLICALAGGYGIYLDLISR